MSVKVNLVIDEQVKAELQALIPAGERSRFANEALRKQLALVRQRQALARLDELRRAGPNVATNEVLLALRALREGN